MEATIILPEMLFTHFLWALNYRISYQYRVKPMDNSFVWYNIPGKDRLFITTDELENSFFVKMKDLIGLGFIADNPVIADGDYWMDKIRKAVDGFEPYSPIDSQNLCIFDKKMQLVVFYDEEFCSLFVWGKTAKQLFNKIKR